MSVDAQGTYQGLYFGRQPATVYDDEGSVLVQAEAARAVLAAQSAAESIGGRASALSAGASGSGGALQGTTSANAGSVREPNGPYAARSGGAATTMPTMFSGTVELDPQMLTKSAGEIGQAVVQHLAGIYGAQVTVRLEIEAHVPSGVPEKVVRDVTENARTLKFRTAEFD